MESLLQDHYPTKAAAFATLKIFRSQGSTSFFLYLGCSRRPAEGSKHFYTVLEPKERQTIKQSRIFHPSQRFINALHGQCKC